MNKKMTEDKLATSNQHHLLHQTQISLARPTTFTMDASNTSPNHTVVTTSTTEKMTRPMALALLPYGPCIEYTAYCMLAFNAIRRATCSRLPKHNRTHQLDGRATHHSNLRPTAPLVVDSCMPAGEQQRIEDICVREDKQRASTMVTRTQDKSAVSNQNQQLQQM
jgi:hypothetical protein